MRVDGKDKAGCEAFFDYIRIRLKEAGVKEVFSSIQGEGTHMGQPQIFVRFSQCNLDCVFCDEKKKKKSKKYSVDKLLAQIEKADRSKCCDTISITGGEPLLHSSYLKRFLPLTRERNYKIYLETNGTLPAARPGRGGWWWRRLPGVKTPGYVHRALRARKLRTSGAKARPPATSVGLGSPAQAATARPGGPYEFSRGS